MLENQRVIGLMLSHTTLHNSFVEIKAQITNVLCVSIKPPAGIFLRVQYTDVWSSERPLWRFRPRLVPAS